MDQQICYGVDAKILQYEENAKVRCEKQIDLPKIIEGLFNKKVTQNLIMLNLEKDTQRYSNTLKEIKKISFENFKHLKGTYWKNKDQVENDLFQILSFVSQFNPDANISEIKINEFAEVSDKNIYIQGGPLGCYCSHLRAMIYGYLNFEDYTIIIEDDISIVNTEAIETYIKQIPNDWDVICLNSVSKNRIYNEPFYKFTDDFHSTHFYIIKNKCFSKIFKGMYPITDQVDVLLSNKVNELNIYNIPETVYQKDIATNTQNNLHVIFTSPNYAVLRNALKIIEELCNFFINKILENNSERNAIIVENLIYDVIFEYILKTSCNTYKNENIEDYQFDNSEYKKYTEYDMLLNAITLFIRCSRKGINSKDASTSLLNTILFTMQNFKLHNKIVNNEILKAYSFGSTSQTYLSKNKIVKVYNDKLRWAKEEHDSPNSIFEKEIEILKRIQELNHTPKLIDYDNKTITMSYCGESLYNDFKLPSNWKDQIKEAFDELDSIGIFYPEFRLQNILILNDKITFVDYGLAEICNENNEENYKLFISLLETFEKKFQKTTERSKRHELIDTMLRSINII